MSTVTTATAGRSSVEAIVRRDEGRNPELLRRKYRRMGADLFAFFRGTDHLFASAWAELGPVDPGPRILICGDLHLENFGAYRAGDGSFVFDINDFDEATVAPGSVDLARCSTSILLAAQVWGLSPIQAMRTVLGFLDSYRATIAEAADGDHAGRSAQFAEFGPVGDLLGECALSTQDELLDRLTRVDRSGARSIRKSEGKLPALGKARAATVAESVESYGRGKGPAAAYKVLDVSGRIAGIGSLGVRRYVALVAGDGSPGGCRLLDIKEAAPSAIQESICAGGPRPGERADDARRVVDAQRRLQARPAAGLDAIALDGREYRLRELIPDENRARLDRFRRKPSKLRRAVEVAGKITAWSQLRGARLDEVDRAGDLIRWAASPALDAVLASAIRFADRSRGDYKAFVKARLDQEA